MDISNLINNNHGCIHPLELIEMNRWVNNYKLWHEMPTLSELEGKNLNPLHRKMRFYLQCEQLREYWLNYGTNIIYCTDEYLKEHNILLSQNQGKNRFSLLGEVELKDEYGESVVLHVLFDNENQ